MGFSFITKIPQWFFGAKGFFTKTPPFAVLEVGFWSRVKLLNNRIKQFRLSCTYVVSYCAWIRITRADFEQVKHFGKKKKKMYVYIYIYVYIIKQKSSFPSSHKIITLSFRVWEWVIVRYLLRLLRITYDAHIFFFMNNIWFTFSFQIYTLSMWTYLFIKRTSFDNSWHSVS